MQLLTIIKKELYRFFSDRRMLMSAFIPGMIMFMVYAALGQVLNNEVDQKKENYRVYISEDRNDIEKLLCDYDVEYNVGDNIYKAIEDEDYDLYLQYGDGSVDIYYDSSSNNSLYIFELVYQHIYNDAVLISYRYQINEKDITRSKGESYDYIAIMGPYLLAWLIFSSCMGTSLSSIAAEKDRGTIATLLVTPCKRQNIALGKSIAMGIIGIFQSIISFVFTLLSLNLSSRESLSVTSDIFSPINLIAMFFVIIFMTLFYTSVLCLISCLAKDVKEANSYATPVMVLIMIVAIFVSMGSFEFTKFYYAVPIVNNVLVLKDIFKGTIDMNCVILAYLMDVVYIVICTYLLDKALNNECIMFSK